MSIGSVVFAQVTADCRVTLYFTIGRPYPQKMPHSHGYLDSSNTWFLGPDGVLKLNGILISLAVFVSLTTVT